MSVFLRLLGWLVLLLGLGTAVLAWSLLAGDVHFAEVEAAYARHAEHPLFQAEYWVAAVHHYALVAGIVVGLLGGVVASAILLGLAAVLRRLPPG